MEDAPHPVPGPAMDTVYSEHVRLLTKVARMYHERDLKQPQIAQQLHISQPRVSRLLKQAVELGIVRTTVLAPRGVHSELEDQIEQAYGLSEVVIADTDAQAGEQEVLRALGSAAAVYLETTLIGSERIGVSSWSETLLATVEAMRPRPTPVADQVVQMLGGVGNVTAQSQATRITGRLAQLTGATTMYLPAPGLLASADMRQMFVTDPNIDAVLKACDNLTMALVGVGSVEPSPLLRESGNAIAKADMTALRKAGAVGDVCMRFFDKFGKHVDSALDERVLGVTPDVLRAIPRRVGVAGGTRKYTAIKAAIRGGWVNVLITDLQIAEQLASPRALAEQRKR